MAAKEGRRRKKAKSRTQVEISSSSESDSDVPQQSKSKKVNGAKAPKPQQDGDVDMTDAPQSQPSPQSPASSSPSPSPAPASTLARPKSQKDIDEEFSVIYLQKVTAELADDLVKVRDAPDFKASSLPMLVHALKQGASVYGVEEKRRVVNAGNGV